MKATTRTRTLLGAGVTASLLAVGGWVALTGARGADTVERVDFGVTRTSTSPTFAAFVEPASSARVKEFRIPMTHDVIGIADGTTYEGWTFGGTVPGPTIRVNEGDLVRITLVNESNMPHSIDFHSARIPMDQAFRTILPGEELRFEFRAEDPGVFMVHCGTPPVLQHIAMGMYLAIIVDPARGWGTRADREIILVQSEFYAAPGADEGAPMQGDWQAMQDKRASHVVFNGKAFQYQHDPLQVEVGDRVRFFVMNAGPSFRSDFHVVGAIFDRVYPDGNPRNALQGVQTYPIPAGGGAVFETVFEEGKSGEGLYAFVTHAFADAHRGAVGLIRVGTPATATMAH
jgi:nitrite reductase (NO-forming)